jgi:flagellar hook-length control protein FliK
VQVAVHDPQWPRAVAAQLLMLGEQKIQAATLRLSPEHLGPVEVRIDLQDSRVNVAFTAAHVETRAALEQSIPQLREVFAGSGLTLGEATVQSQARHGSQNQGDPVRPEPAAVDSPSSREPAARAVGLVDEYV